MDNKKIVEYLYKCKEIKKFCKDNKLDENTILKCFSQFSTYKDSLDDCAKCKVSEGSGVSSCQSRVKNNIVDIVLDENGYVITKVHNCPKIIMSDPNIFEVLFFTDNDIDIEATAARANLFVFFDKFMEDYFKGGFTKGIYLHGKCGTGKSIMLHKFGKKLVSKGAKVMFAYYPDLVRHIQNSFGTENQEELVLKLKTTDILMLDDIGREANTQYIRDEILGPILQYRVDNNLPLFLTSNRNYEELEKHLSETNNYVDVVKARALMERIKYLTKEYKLVDKDFRNN